MDGTAIEPPNNYKHKYDSEVRTMNICLRTRLIKNNLVKSLCRLSTTVPEVEENEHFIIDDTDDAAAKENEIQKNRNKSRLSDAHYNLVNGRRPYEEPKSLAHLTVKYHRKMYGKYGITSGVNPSLCWPTKKEIEEKIEYESIAYPYTIKAAMDAAAEKRKEEAIRIQLRDKEVAEKYAKLEQWKKDLNDRLAKKVAEVETAKAKKERLVEEVRRHFGFTLDPRDERFQEMLAKREKEQRKQERQAKRDAKEKQLIAKLQQKSAEISDKTS